MPFYPVVPPDVTPGYAEDAALGLLGQASVVAVRVADLAACPARQGLGRDGRTALTATGASRVRSGDLVVWLKPVAVAPRWCAATGGSRPPGIRLITPGWAWPRSGWMSCAGYPA